MNATMDQCDNLDVVDRNWDQIPASFDRTNRRSRHRRVLFNPKVRTVKNPSILSTNDIQNIWWSSEELVSIKKNAKRMCLVLRKSYGGTGLLNCHEKQGGLVFASDIPDLYQWFCFTDGRRGLERFASKSFAIRRHRDIMDTRLAVMREQARWSELTTTIDHGQHDEAIARVAKLASENARAFATWMGEADSHASSVITTTSCEERQDDEERLVMDVTILSVLEPDRPTKRSKTSNAAGNSPAA